MEKLTMAGGWEWLIVLLVVVLIFGVGRISKIGEELGKGISAFRQGLKEGAQENSAEKENDKNSTS
jgi:sec-independent protein translocase protein TatA